MCHRDLKLENWVPGRSERHVFFWVGEAQNDEERVDSTDLGTPSGWARVSSGPPAIDWHSYFKAISVDFHWLKGSEGIFFGIHGLVVWWCAVGFQNPSSREDLGRLDGVMFFLVHPIWVIIPIDSRFGDWPKIGSNLLGFAVWRSIQKNRLACLPCACPISAHRTKRCAHFFRRVHTTPDFVGLDLFWYILIYVSSFNCYQQGPLRSPGLQGPQRPFLEAHRLWLCQSLQGGSDRFFGQKCHPKPWINWETMETPHKYSWFMTVYLHTSMIYYDDPDWKPKCDGYISVQFTRISPSSRNSVVCPKLPPHTKNDGSHDTAIRWWSEKMIGVEVWVLENGNCHR